MFAVIRTGGKQYKVAKGDLLAIERLQVKPGATVGFDSVLMVGDGSSATVGAPYVEGGRVTAQVVEQARSPKITVFKKKRRKNHRRKNGHRQDLTVLQVTEILAEGGRPRKTSETKPKAEDGPPTEPDATEQEPREGPATEVKPAKKASAKKTSKPRTAAENED